MTDILTIAGVEKRYKSGHRALKRIDLTIRRGEIFALLGPNGAGKTTLISIICGIVTPSTGTIVADGHDVVRDYKLARRKIGLVPQELSTDLFETVWSVVRFSRGLFGCPPDDARLETILRQLSLWDKRHAKIKELSGGMKRRVLIAKALSHDPVILFLDEPTAGVDVDLRRDMWEMVRTLREDGVTIILTTHYIEEAQEMADRIGVINGGEIVLVQDKAELMQTLGSQTLTLTLATPVAALPDGIADPALALSDDGRTISYVASGAEAAASIARMIRVLDRAGLDFTAIDTRRSSLEDIFVDLVKEEAR
ncbi:MAG: ABC transporter ATP-binding protein [Sphingomonas sp.]